VLRRAVLPSTEHLVLLAMWAFWCVMLYYSQASISDMKPFDPFEILGVPRDASDRDIKKAYRQLSLIYHPDKVRARCGAGLPGAWVLRPGLCKACMH
jgi:preprotein translocase subunit Sec63